MFASEPCDVRGSHADRQRRHVTPDPRHGGTTGRSALIFLAARIGSALTLGFLERILMSSFFFFSFFLFSSLGSS